MKRAPARKTEKRPSRILTSVAAVFDVSACLLLAFKTMPPDWTALLLAAVLPVLTVASVRFCGRFLFADELILAVSNFLCGLGVIVLYALSPERGLRQCSVYALGLAAMIVSMRLVRAFRGRRVLTWLLALVSLALLALPVAIGRETNGAKNWIDLPVFGSFQPSELVKLSLLLILAEFFSDRRGALSMVPGLLFSVACLGLLMLQKDLGTALLYYLVTLLLWWAASSNLPLTLAGAAGGAGAAVAGYRLFAHVRTRVAIWHNPWSDALGSGYQLVQALTAIASGGLFGLGLGLGAPRVIPAYSTDFIFAVICEQFGILFGLCVIGLYVILVLRGVGIALKARRSFDALLAMGCSLLIGLQTFVIIGGVIKLIPLTGITLPFISYGGTSLLSSLCVTGMLCGLSARAEEDLREDARLAGTIT